MSQAPSARPRNRMRYVLAQKVLGRFAIARTAPRVNLPGFNALRYGQAAGSFAFRKPFVASCVDGGGMFGLAFSSARP